MSVSYIQGRPIIGNLILPITRYLRAINAERYLNTRRYINSRETLLDIGCGDRFFIERQKINCIGIDKLYGTPFINNLNFDDSTFNYVTMLAVIEHIEKPELLLKEIHRVLKPEGRLIFTTPKKQAEFLFRLYAKDIDEEHETYFDVERVRNLAGNMFDIEDYKTFIFGLNQVFCLKKKVAREEVICHT